MSKLETKHLTLKVRALGDVDALTKLYSAPDRDTVVKSIFLSDTHWRKNGFGYWSIFLKNELIGNTGLKRLADGKVSFEMEIDSKQRRKGYGTEASKSVLDFGFRLHKIPEIWVTVKTLDSVPSKFLQSLGFTQVPNTVESPSFVLQNPTKR